MKKLLFLLFLICSIQTTQAVSIEITKIYGRITTSFSGTTKDSLLKNNAALTSNLTPLTILTFYCRWKDLDVISAPFDKTVYFKVYQTDGNTDTEIFYMSHIIQSSDNNDSTTIYLPINLSPTNPIGQYSYKMKVTYFEDPQTEKVISESSIWKFSIVADPNGIVNNTICSSQTVTFSSCSQIVTFPYTPPIPIGQLAGTAVAAPVAVLPITFIWQQKNGASGNWTTIAGATGASYQPGSLSQDTYFQRVAFVKRGTSTESYSISNTVSYTRLTCDRPPIGSNQICGDQAYYNLKHGDVIHPTIIKGSAFYESNEGRDAFVQFISSENGGEDWTMVKGGGLSNLTLAPVDYQPADITYDINKGAVQYIYIKRNYYEIYDSWDCGPFNIPHPCGKKPHLKDVSNTVAITLTSFSTPKPVATSITNESLEDFVDCLPGAQVKTFSVPRVNNGETYKWEIPSAWTAYTTLEGPYANSITINTNSANANYGIGGNVCLTITQPGQVNSMCSYIAGSDPFRVVLPSSIKGCEGQMVIVDPVVLVNNVVQNSFDYNFTWEAYQTPDYTCTNGPNKYHPDCKGLKINIASAYQNTTQPIKVTVLNAHKCIAMASTVLTTTPGLQMGILYSYTDPKALSTSTLAPDTTNNYLYFTDANKNIERAYFDNTQQVWKYVVLKDKIKNTLISSDGPLIFYKDNTSKLFYALRGALYYAESLDNGLTWTDNFATGSLINGLDNRFKVWSNNIYYINTTDRKVYYKPISNTTVQPILVGNATVNYSQNMFTVEEGIVAYADYNNDIVAFDALTGAAFPITFAWPFTNPKAVNYNSTIAVYNKNIYFISTAGTLRILQKSPSEAAYKSFQQTSAQLAGQFTINRQTGTVYAKAYDVAGKQIYFLNNQWNELPIKNYIDPDPIQSSMIYANNHAYYIGTNGLVSNTFYVAPCVPAVLRTANTADNVSGDIQNDPLPLNREAVYNLSVYPNPAQDQIKVDFSLVAENDINIRINDIDGGIDEVLLSKHAEEGTYELELSLNKYAAGMYIIQLYINGVLDSSSKLIKY